MAVKACPSWALPEIEGGAVFDGGAGIGAAVAAGASKSVASPLATTAPARPRRAPNRGARWTGRGGTRRLRQRDRTSRDPRTASQVLSSLPRAERPILSAFDSRVISRTKQLFAGIAFRPLVRRRGFTQVGLT